MFPQLDYQRKFVEKKYKAKRKKSIAQENTGANNVRVCFERF